MDLVISNVALHGNCHVIFLSKGLAEKHVSVICCSRALNKKSCVKLTYSLSEPCSVSMYKEANKENCNAHILLLFIRR